MVTGTPGGRRPDLTRDENDVLGVTNAGMQFAVGVHPYIMRSKTVRFGFFLTTIGRIAEEWVGRQQDPFRTGDLVAYLSKFGLALHYQEVYHLLMGLVTSLVVEKVEQEEGLFRTRAGQ